jgi:hypothetical protein
METIKSVLGYGTTKADEGQEPVNGEQGAGNAVDPYDHGNSEEPSLGGEAAQDTSLASSDGQSGLAANDTSFPIPTPQPSEQYPTAQSKVEDNTPAHASSGQSKDASLADVLALPSANSTTGGSSTFAHDTSSTSAPTIGNASSALINTPAVDSTPASELPADEPKKSSIIGSSGWFKTALPLGQSKPATDTSKSTPAATEQEQSTTSANPIAAATSSEPSVAPATAPTPTQEETREPELSHADLPPNHLPTNVPEGESTDLEHTTGATSFPTTASTSSPAASEPSNTTPHASRFTDEPVAPDTSLNSRDHRASINPEAIPTAGGKPLGVAAEDPGSESSTLGALEHASGIDSALVSPKTNVANPLESSPVAGSTSGTTVGGSSATPALRRDPTPVSVGSEKEDKSEGHGKHKHNFLHKIKEKIKH